MPRPHLRPLPSSEAHSHPLCSSSMTSKRRMRSMKFLSLSPASASIWAFFCFVPPFLFLCFVSQLIATPQRIQQITAQQREERNELKSKTSLERIAQNDLNKRPEFRPKSTFRVFFLSSPFRPFFRHRPKTRHSEAALNYGQRISAGDS